jgi:hypothetical protein
MKHYIKLKDIAITVVALGLFTACGDIGSGSGSNDLNHNSIQYGTVKSPYTERIWIDRNVGAQRVCLSSTDEKCYGDYYQYGRNADGHEKKNSQTRDTKIKYLNKSDDKFFLGEHTWFDGSTYILEENWEKLDGSSVCPKNFRVANEEEFYDELLRDGSSAQVVIDEDLFATFLKIPKAGYRYYNAYVIAGSYDTLALLTGLGYSIDYWAAGGESLIMDYGRIGIYDEFRLYSLGRPIRCIEATEEELAEAKEMNENS